MSVSPAVPSTHASRPQRGWYKRNEIAITPWLFLLLVATGKGLRYVSVVYFSALIPA